MEKMTDQELLRQWASLMKGAAREDVQIRFDEESDELLVNLSRERFRDVSVYVAENIALRIAPDRSRIYGLQIENFISAIVPRFPELLSFLDWANLNDEDVMRIRRQANRDPLGMVGEQLVQDISRLTSVAD